ncbi:hypothetical protein [Legionella longbeachae]|uniref:Secreted protein n=1 Tax=Legionella longbeachae serogroup 1 (strain NSW150) TaxID=661367 RepID=D3HMM1_LEGLN|nr:hypothetical protein [Legionella longbeachae]VEE04136.1 Uncharacterised protein [Legionella oakridgensis]HBD7396991.1 hypothetical protein [Legionella pneumophila]ARB93028.1 hypothetical protein A6J40_12945 [Legionella longbeachae]ARM33911.1 hypothetical protein B0B39_10405 [Legionella longbeachae]EEZ96888.1 conserved hypothetical protein [Legionella longbeachae D-4968]
MIKKKLVVTFLGFWAVNCFSFGVDVCFNSPTTTPVIQNCINLDSSCRTSNLTKAQEVTCRIAALADGLSGLSGSNNIIGGRSLVHSDSTYLMAQLIGFTPWQAYQIMIYDEATDQSDYVPYNQNGAQMLTDDEIANCRDHWGPSMPNQCLIITRVMSGIYKFNYTTGGMLLHLHARFSPDGTPPPALPYPTDYLSEANKPYEVVLNNFHAWVFDERINACSSGILHADTPPYASKSACEDSSRTLYSPMYFFAPGISPKPIPFVTTLGPLIINESTPNTIATDASFNAYIKPHDVTYAKPGIFFHALADRYSHHMCTDNSYFYQDSNGNYTSVYSKVLCAQGSHFLWHAWEQGTNQSTSNLAAQYQTMRPALEAIFDQLVAYRKFLGGTVKPIDKAALMNELMTVLAIEDPVTRLNNMVNLMEAHGALSLPGHGTTANLTIDQWLTLAGAPI